MKIKKKMSFNNNLLQVEYYRIMQAIRKEFSRSTHYKAFKLTKLSKLKGKRGGKMYICDGCEESFIPKHMETHHEPEIVRESEHYSDVKPMKLINRVYADFDKLRYYCKPCHDKHHGKKPREI